MKLLQADTLTTEMAKEAADTAKSLLSGDTTLGEVGQQCIGWCVEAGKALIVAVLIYVVGKFLIKLANTVLAKMLERRNVDATVQSFLKSLVNILLTILLLITVVSALGINTTSFAALLASLGVALGMALSGNLQNFAGGLVILFFKPFRVGDYIEAQGVQGTVKEIQIFHTIIATVDNKTIYLPNGSLSSGTCTNYNNEVRRVDVTVSVEYGEDVDKVKAELEGIIKANDLILSDKGHEPFVALAALADSSVDFTVRCWTKGADYWTVYFYMQETVYKTFNRKDIGFPYPHITINKV